VTEIYDIIEEIKRLMAIKYPTAQAYVNICPLSYTRPAYLIRCPEFDLTDVNRSTVKISANLTIAYLTDADVSNLSSTALLSNVQETILSIFRDGYITIGNRKIKVKSSAGDIDYNEANIDLQFEYFDDRSDAVESTPMMSSIITKTKLN